MSHPIHTKHPSAIITHYDKTLFDKPHCDKTSYDLPINKNVTGGALREVLISPQVNRCSRRVYTYVYFLWEDATSNDTKMGQSQPY